MQIYPLVFTNFQGNNNDVWETNLITSSDSSSIYVIITVIEGLQLSFIKSS